jgi:hypothetical protein
MPTAIALEQFVTEWFIDDQTRYERLTIAPLPVTRTIVSGVAHSVTPTVIGVVLNVPRKITDQVTTLLRSSPILGIDNYFQRAADALDTATLSSNRTLELELYIKELEGLARSCASSLDKVMSPTNEYTRRHVDKTIVSMRGKATLTRLQITEALNNRRADVAAKLLIALPDEDWI